MWLVLNGELYTHKFQKLIYLSFYTDCFMNISLQLNRRDNILQALSPPPPPHFSLLFFFNWYPASLIYIVFASLPANLDERDKISIMFKLHSFKHKKQNSSNSNGDSKKKELKSILVLYITSSIILAYKPISHISQPLISLLFYMTPIQVFSHTLFLKKSCILILHLFSAYWVIFLWTAFLFLL